MRIQVIYDSQFGNTAQIAQAIADGLRRQTAAGDVVEPCHVDAADAARLREFDLLVMGAPTQGFRPKESTRDLLAKIPRDALRCVKVVAFDTRMTDEEMHSHGAVLGKTDST